MDEPGPGQVESGPIGAGMIYHIRHKTNYTYSAPVFLEPHTVCLCPRNDMSQKISSFSMKVEPQPAGMQHFLDAEGNNGTCIWFNEKTPALSIATSFTAQTFGTNPFSYLVTDEAFLQLPVEYKRTDAEVLAPFRTAPEAGGAVASFGKAIFAATKGATLDFLSLLCAAIYEDFTVEIREKGPPLSPAAILQTRKGACRDLALLYMAVCRCFGLATRFVSGYQEGDPDMRNRHLHAWAEVYIPGGGWRGYDPSHGLTVADRHIALAASYDPAVVSPVRGNFRGTGISSTSDYHISLTRDLG